MTKYLLTIFSLFSIAFAQLTHEKCGLTDYEQYLENQYPGFHNAVKATFNKALLHSQSKVQLKGINSTPDTIFRVPVVFHVIYNTSDSATQNIPDSILQNQIEVLNTDYRRLNADTVNTRAIFKDRASDVGFEFFLATIDPDGNPTTGITRTPTAAVFGGFFGDMDAMKKDSTGGKDAWNNAEYLNVWVCDLSGGFGTASILGFAYPPTAAPNWDQTMFPADPTVDGVALHYEIVGANNPLSQTGMLAGLADRGRTAVHEIGHYFGLRHIWGDAGFFGSIDCDITLDDGFSDTPHMGNNSQNDGCNFSKNSCTNGESPDEPDMVENYMDYSTEACQNMFTLQQANLMRSMAVIGRPNVTHILENDTFTISNGTWIVVNGTDTVQITANNSYTYSTGDEIMILNENNGITYTATDNGTFSSGSNAYVKDDATLSSSEEVAIRTVNLEAVKMYPNPTNSFVKLEHLSTINCTEIEITDISGRILKTEKIVSDNAVLDVKHLNNGIYFIAFKNNNTKLGFKKLQIINR